MQNKRPRGQDAQLDKTDQKLSKYMYFQNLSGLKNLITYKFINRLRANGWFGKKLP